jgi:hypothetical protein
MHAPHTGLALPELWEGPPERFRARRVSAEEGRTAPGVIRAGFPITA